MTIEADPCPISPIAEIVFARWTTHVLWVLQRHGRMRFTELLQRVRPITPKVLAARLRQLEQDGLVERTYHPEMPPRVEYEATPLAATLSPVFATLVKWSDDHLDDVNEARRRFRAEDARPDAARSGARS